MRAHRLIFLSILIGCTYGLDKYNPTAVIDTSDEINIDEETDDPPSPS